MIAVELAGGLGNQMFQYAYALGMAGGRRDDISLVTSKLACADVPREFELGAFGLTAGPAVAFPRKRVLAIGAGGYEAIDVGDGPDVSLMGMWMGEGPWVGAETAVRRTLRLPDDPIEAIGVHVRRADFLVPRSPMIELGADYYRRALERLPRLPVLVFTDAPDWARKHVRGILVDERDPHAAMALLSRCRHHVIANSSFSWWAAWLGEKGTVVAPSRWLKNNDAVTKQIVPDRWRIV